MDVTNRNRLDLGSMQKQLLTIPKRLDLDCDELRPALSRLSV